MKNLIIIILFICLSLNIYSKMKLDIDMKYKDGKTFDSSIPILPEDIITFHSGNLSLNWFFVLETREKPFIQMQLKKESNTLEFYVDSFKLDWYEAAKYCIKGSNTIYKGNLICQSTPLDESSIQDTLPLLFNLAPSKPEFLNLEFFYDEFFPETFEFTNQSCNFKIYCKGNPTKIYCAHTIADPTDEEFKHRYFLYTTNSITIPNDSNIYSATTDWTWRQFIKLMAENKYGISLPSDTIFTCDYINDKEVIDAWNASVSSPEIQNISISVSNKQIRLNVLVDELSVYDTFGKLLARKRQTDSIDLDYISRQLCIVRIKNKDVCITKKIIL